MEGIKLTAADFFKTSTEKHGKRWTIVEERSIRRKAKKLARAAAREKHADQWWNAKMREIAASPPLGNRVFENLFYPKNPELPTFGNPPFSEAFPEAWWAKAADPDESIESEIERFKQAKKTGLV